MWQFFVQFPHNVLINEALFGWFIVVYCMSFIWKTFISYLQQQTKLASIQDSKKDMEEKVEALRTAKETAEQPEKEAKERHLKAWEGKFNC